MLPGEKSIKVNTKWLLWEGEAEQAQVQGGAPALEFHELS